MSESFSAHLLSFHHYIAGSQTNGTITRLRGATGISPFYPCSVALARRPYFYDGFVCHVVSFLEIVEFRQFRAALPDHLACTLVGFGVLPKDAVEQCHDNTVFCSSAYGTAESTQFAAHTWALLTVNTNGVGVLHSCSSVCSKRKQGDTFLLDLLFYFTLLILSILKFENRTILPGLGSRQLGDFLI